MLSGRTRTPRNRLIDDDGKAIAVATIPWREVLIEVSGGCEHTLPAVTSLQP